MPAQAGCSTRCQVPGCRANLSGLRQYYQRYHICAEHVREEQVAFGDELCRFCQLCGRFHALDAFDDNRRSCRDRLAKHNDRRKLKHLSEREAKPRRKSVMATRKARSVSPSSTPSSPSLAALTDASSSHDCQAEHDELPFHPFFLDNNTLKRELNLHDLVLSEPACTIPMQSLDQPASLLDTYFLSAPDVWCPRPGSQSTDSYSSHSPSPSSDDMDDESEDMEVLMLWKEWRGEAHNQAKPSASKPLAGPSELYLQRLFDSMWHNVHIAPTLEQLI